MKFLISFFIFIFFIICSAIIMAYEIFKFKKMEKATFIIIGEVLLIIANIINFFVITPFISFFLYFEIQMAEGFKGPNLEIFISTLIFLFLFNTIPYLFGIVSSFIYDKKYSMKIALLVIVTNLINCSIVTLSLLNQIK